MCTQCLILIYHMKPLMDIIFLSSGEESETPSFRLLSQQAEVQSFPGVSQLQTPVGE